MTIRKAILALCMVGFLVVSALSIVGQDIYLPGAFLGELTGNGGGRLVVIRSAVFLTMAFFIYRHLRNKRPLSSVAPVQVFVNSLLVVGVFRLPLSTEYWIDWLIVACLCVASVLLYFENRGEAQRIFKNDW
jgi:hypothetical protein